MSSPISRLLDEVEWETIPEDGHFSPDTDVYATHQGILRIAGLEFKAYQLNTGERVIDADDVERLLGDS